MSRQSAGAESSLSFQFLLYHVQVIECGGVPVLLRNNAIDELNPCLFSCISVELLIVQRCARMVHFCISVLESQQFGKRRSHQSTTATSPKHCLFVERCLINKINLNSTPRGFLHHRTLITLPRYAFIFSNCALNSSRFLLSRVLSFSPIAVLGD